MKKIEPLCSIQGELIAFKVGGLSFVSLEDIKKFLKINKNFIIDDVTISYYALGVPEYVNLNKTIENNYKVVYYEIDELQLSPDKNYNP